MVLEKLDGLRPGSRGGGGIGKHGHCVVVERVPGALVHLELDIRVRGDCRPQRLDRIGGYVRVLRCRPGSTWAC